MRRHTPAICTLTAWLALAAGPAHGAELTLAPREQQHRFIYTIKRGLHHKRDFGPPTDHRHLVNFNAQRLFFPLAARVYRNPARLDEHHDPAREVLVVGWETHGGQPPRTLAIKVLQPENRAEPFANFSLPLELQQLEDLPLINQGVEILPRLEGRPGPEVAVGGGGVLTNRDSCGVKIDGITWKDDKRPPVDHRLQMIDAVTKKITQSFYLSRPRAAPMIGYFGPRGRFVAVAGGVAPANDGKSGEVVKTIDVFDRLGALSSEEILKRYPGLRDGLPRARFGGKLISVVDAAHVEWLLALYGTEQYDGDFLSGIPSPDLDALPLGPSETAGSCDPGLQQQARGRAMQEHQQVQDPASPPSWVSKAVMTPRMYPAVARWHSGLSTPHILGTGGGRAETKGLIDPHFASTELVIPGSFGWYTGQNVGSYMPMIMRDQRKNREHNRVLEYSGHAIAFDRPTEGKEWASREFFLFAADRSLQCEMHDKAAGGSEVRQYYEAHRPELAAQKGTR